MKLCRSWRRSSVYIIYRNALADALHDASDHVPVVGDADCDFVVGINDFLAVLGNWSGA